MLKCLDELEMVVEELELARVGPVARGRAHRFVRVVPAASSPVQSTRPRFEQLQKVTGCS